MRAEYKLFFITEPNKSLPSNSPAQEAFSREGLNINGDLVPLVFVEGGEPGAETFQKLLESVAFKLDPSSRATEEPASFKEHSDYYGLTQANVKSGLVTISTDYQAKNRQDGDLNKFSRVVRPRHLSSVSADSKETFKDWPDEISQLPLTHIEVNVNPSITTRSDYQISLSEDFINWLNESFTKISNNSSDHFKKEYYEEETGVVNKAKVAESLTDNLNPIVNSSYYGYDNSGNKGWHTLPSNDILPNRTANTILKSNSSNILEFASINKEEVVGIKIADSPTFAGITTVSHGNIGGNLTVGGTINGVNLSLFYNDLSAHKLDSSAHGAVGGIVGVDNVQTLNNKTLNSFNIADGGLISIPSNLGVTFGNSDSKIGFFGAAPVIAFESSIVSLPSDIVTASSSVPVATTFTSNLSTITNTSAFGFSTEDDLKSVLELIYTTKNIALEAYTALLSLGIIKENSNI